MTFQWTIATTGNVTGANVTFSLKGANFGAPTLASGPNFSLLPSGSLSLFSSALPQGSGTYAIADNSESIRGSGNTTRWDLDYTSPACDGRSAGGRAGARLALARRDRSSRRPRVRTTPHV